MGEEYVPLADAARFEGIDYETMKKHTQRYPDRYKICQEPRENGRPRTLVAVSSLSYPARRAWRAAQRINEPKGEDVLTEQCDEIKRPWYIEADHQWYIENHRDAYFKALALADLLRRYQNYAGEDRTAYAEQFAEENGMTPRTLYRLSKQYLEASMWALKFERLTGGNYDYLKTLALCRKPKEAGRFPGIAEETKALIENIWFDRHFRANRGTVTMLYSKLEELTLEREIACPSYQTVARYIRHLTDNKGGRTAAVLAERGVRGWKNEVMVKGVRDVGAIPVMGIVQGDEHTFDCWVAVTASNGKIRAVRPKLVAWIDMRSRVIMGDVICIDANAQVLKQSLTKLIYGYGLPEYLLIDNGRDYTAREMTGRSRNDRGGLSFDSDTVGFYRALGIKDNMRSLPYEPWGKAQIERVFGTVCSTFTRWMDSYTGTLTGALTAGKVRKDVDAMLQNGELLSIEAFYEVWTRWLQEVYLVRPHGGLKDAGEQWTKPLELLRNCEQRYERPAPPQDFAAMIMMKADRCKVRNIGIQRWGNAYMCEELNTHINEKVDIRYDPDDLSRIYVYTTSGSQIGVAYRQERLPVGYRLDSDAIAQHKSKQARQLRDERQRLAHWTTPYEERQQDGAGKRPVVGALDLTIKADPPPKVVTLPIDRQYAEETKQRRKPEESQYISERGRAALERIKNLG